LLMDKEKGRAARRGWGRGVIQSGKGKSRKDSSIFLGRGYIILALSQKGKRER